MFDGLFRRTDNSRAEPDRNPENLDASIVEQGANIDMTNSDGTYDQHENLPDTLTTSIGEGSELEGDLDIKGQLNIHGSVNGRVRCDGEVFIGDSGRVTGEILAMNIRVAGQMEGSLECGELTILGNGKVTGEAATDTFVISEGGEFEGTSRRRTADNVTQLMRGARKSPAASLNAVRD